MALFNNFPYTDFENLNLDWFLKNFKQLLSDFDKLDDDVKKEIQDMYNLLNNSIQEYVGDYVDNHLSQFLLGAMYIEENTCIKLQQATVIGDSDHVYNNATESIIVLEGR